jgi:hypothetical protein
MPSRHWLAISAAALVTTLTWLVLPAAAHHASAPFYDPENRVEFEGTVTRWVFRNPHAFLFLDVEGPDGAVTEWQVELGAPVSIRRAGWTPDTLTIGQRVLVSGNRSRAEGSNGVCCVRMTRPDGTPVTEGGAVREASVD